MNDENDEDQAVTGLIGTLVIGILIQHAKDNLVENVDGQTRLNLKHA